MDVLPMNLIEEIAQRLELHDESFAVEILQAIEDAGYVCVPKEPTAEMLIAGYAEIKINAAATTSRCYKAMLATAPDVTE